MDTHEDLDPALRLGDLADRLTGPDPYAHLAQRFVSHYDSLRGAVRYALVSRQLDAHLQGGRLTIVDVGGGAGHQALRLARAGHVVTLVDPSAEMIERARAALADEPAEISDRVELVLADAKQASTALRTRFDVVCCHAVLPYVDDGPELVDHVARLAGRGAVLSLVFKNADALAMRPALEGRWADAVAAFDRQEDVGGLGVPTRAHRLADVETWVRDAGFEVEDWYGIRVATDHLTGASSDHLDDVLPVEIEASRRDPYRALGRLIHLVARAGEAP